MSSNARPAKIRVATEDWTAAQLIGGKSAADLQSNIAVVADKKITGTLKYVTGYTQFSGVEAEQSGNYLAVKITDGNAASIKVSKNNENWSTLDSDGIVIMRLTDVTTQKLYIESTTSDSTTINYVYDLSELVLEEAE